MDVAVITFTQVVAIQARGLLPVTSDDFTDVVVLSMPGIAALWPILIHSIGAHQLRHQRAGATEDKRFVMPSLTAAGTVGITSFQLKAEFPRGLYALLFTVGTPGLVMARFGRHQLMHAIHREGALLKPVVVAGDVGHVDALAKVLRRESWLGNQVVGAITCDHSAQTLGGLPVLGTVTETVAVIHDQRVAAVTFVGGSFEAPSYFRRMAWKLEALSVLIVVPAPTDVGSQRLHVHPVAGLPAVEVDRQAVEAACRIKRTGDVVGAAALLLLAAPLMGLTTLAIKLEDARPVMFRQRRVGLTGEECDCLKFCSRCIDAKARLTALQATNEGTGSLFKMTNDPRITRMGRFIRRFSLDELPQLRHALRGDTSLGGPRPGPPAEVAQYDSDTRHRLDVRPGLTGLWQVSGRSKPSWDDTVRLDLYYFDNWSMAQDLMILADRQSRRPLLGSLLSSQWRRRESPRRHQPPSDPSKPVPLAKVLDRVGGPDTGNLVALPSREGH